MIVSQQAYVLTLKFIALRSLYALGELQLMNCDTNWLRFGPAFRQNFLRNEIMNLDDYEGHIFDCDGTITDSMPLHFMAWRKATNQFGVEFGEDRFYEMAGMPTDKIIGILAEEQNKSIDIQLATEAKEAAFMELIPQVKPIPYISKCIQSALDAEKKVSVASGGTREAVALQLDAVGLADVFSIRVTAEDTKKHKPEPDVFLKAAELMGLDPGSCVVYEDADLGIQAAKSAGMGFVDVREFHQPLRINI